MRFKLFTFLFCVLLTISAQAKVYDCFMFYDEWEVLEIRLNELNDVVDKFVLVEATESFRGLQKPLYYERMKRYFVRFADKIIHVKVEDHFETDNVWARESYHRDQIMRGLEGCDDNDIIIISDVDELVPASIVPTWTRMLLNRETDEITTHAAANYIGFLNRFDYRPGRTRSSIVTYRYLKTLSPQALRDHGDRFGRLFRVGWHFSAMGGFERCLEKWTNWSHWENYHPMTYEAWRAEMSSFPLVQIDATYPTYIRENIVFLTLCGLIDVP